MAFSSRGGGGVVATLIVIPRHISPLFYPSLAAICLPSPLFSRAPVRLSFPMCNATRDPTLDSPVSYHSSFVPLRLIRSFLADCASFPIRRPGCVCIYTRCRGRTFSAAPYCHRRRVVSLSLVRLRLSDKGSDSMMSPN